MLRSRPFLFLLEPKIQVLDISFLFKNLVMQTQNCVSLAVHCCDPDPHAVTLLLGIAGLGLVFRWGLRLISREIGDFGSDGFFA